MPLELRIKCQGYRHWIGTSYHSCGPTDNRRRSAGPDASCSRVAARLHGPECQRLARASSRGRRTSWTGCVFGRDTSSLGARILRAGRTAASPRIAQQQAADSAHGGTAGTPRPGQTGSLPQPP